MAGLPLRNYGWCHKIVFAARFCLDHSSVEQNYARFQHYSGVALLWLQFALYVWGHRKGFGKSLQFYSVAVIRMLSSLLYNLSP